MATGLALICRVVSIGRSSLPAGASSPEAVESLSLRWPPLRVTEEGPQSVTRNGDMTQRH